MSKEKNIYSNNPYVGTDKRDKWITSIKKEFQK